MGVCENKPIQLAQTYMLHVIIFCVRESRAALEFKDGSDINRFCNRKLVLTIHTFYRGKIFYTKGLLIRPPIFTIFDVFFTFKLYCSLYNEDQ